MIVVLDFLNRLAASTADIQTVAIASLLVSVPLNVALVTQHTQSIRFAKQPSHEPGDVLD
jgi:hypothetical protein